MGDFSKLVGSIKQAALDAVAASNPTSVMFGVVVSTAPLKINVEQKMTLEGAQLILTRNVTEYSVQMTVEHQTEIEAAHVHTIDDETAHTHVIHDTATGGGSSEPTSHTHTMQPVAHLHAYSGTKTFVIHNGLAVGDEVVLLRQQGGQKFVVIDRLG